MQKDLDVIIEHIHAGERAGLLEFSDKISDVTIQAILADILHEASGLSRVSKVSETVIDLPVTPSSPPQNLRSVDRLMNKLPLYRRFRPWLKRKFISSPYVIDGLTLLGYNGKEFVRAAYLGILGRPAEQKDIESLTIPIVTGDLSKIQCIDILLSSDEHAQKNIGVQGLGRRRFFEKLKRRVLRIPVLGYTLRVFSNLVFLSRNIRQLDRRLSLIEYSLDETNKNLARIENILGKEN